MMISRTLDGLVCFAEIPENDFIKYFTPDLQSMIHSLQI